MTTAPLPDERRSLGFLNAWAFEAQFAVDEAGRALLAAGAGTVGAARLADAAFRVLQRAEHLRQARRAWCDGDVAGAAEHMRQLEAIASARVNDSR